MALDIKSLQSKSNIDLYIPSNVESKIRYLCGLVHNTEWSGVLFYKPEGSIEDNTFKITCVDILPMDIGSHTYTEFKDTSADIISYQVDNPELLDPNIQEALIHSHSTFASFFSGTDNNTLIQEGDGRNHFLSLIVNNAGQYVARFTRKLHIQGKIEYKETVATTYKTFCDRVVSLGIPKVTNGSQDIDHYQLEWFECNIHKDSSNEDFNTINERLLTIREEKAKVNNVSTSFVETYKPEFQSTTGKLFDDSEYITSETPQSEITDRQVHHVACQLLTGNILINPDKIDLRTFLRLSDLQYDKLFDNRDPNSPYGLDSWVSNIVEFVLGGYPENQVADLAQKVIKYIEPIQCNGLKPQIRTAVIAELNLYI